MATPPKGRKMAPERPFPILIETGKSYPKTGLLPAVFGGFPGKFDGALPAVFRRRFSSGFPAVRRRFSSGFADSFPAVRRGFPAGGFASGLRQFCRRFDRGFPVVCRRFPVVSGRFSRRFAGDAVPLDQPPVRLRRTPSSERNCRAIPYTLSSLQTQHMGRGKFPPVHGVPGRSAAGRNPTPLVEVLGDRIAVQDASGGISLGTSPTGHSGQRDADFA